MFSVFFYLLHILGYLSVFFYFGLPLYTLTKFLSHLHYLNHANRYLLLSAFFFITCIFLHIWSIQPGVTLWCPYWILAPYMYLLSQNGCILFFAIFWLVACFCLFGAFNPRITPSVRPKALLQNFYPAYVTFSIKIDVFYFAIFWLVAYACLCICSI